MASSLNRLIFVTFAGALAALGACDCGGPPPAGVARIAARFGSGSASVEADGSSVLQISLTATTAENTPELSPISVTAASGGVALRDAGDYATSLSSAPTAQGTLDLDFRCEPQEIGSVALAVANGLLETTVTVRCIEPRGDVVIDVDDSLCASFPADGESTCPVTVTVQRRGAITVNLPGTLEATVLSATPFDSGDTASLRLLSTDGDSSPSESVTIAIDDEGHGTYFVHAPDVAETAEIELVSSGVTIVREQEIEPFVNQAAVAFPSGGITVAGGQVGSLVIDVTNPRGDPADSALHPEDVLDVSIAGGDAGTRPTLTGGGQGPAADLVGVTITDGQVTMSVNTFSVTTVQVYTVTVSYQPLQRLDPIEAQVSVTVNPPGTLLLDVSASPTTLHSDTLNPSELISTISVALTVDGNPAPSGTVTLTIPSESTARVAFVGSDGVAEVPEDDDRAFTLNTSGTGSGTVQLRVTPNVPTGTARVIVVGNSGTALVQREIEVNVERGPILQAIVFEDAQPATIGVQGGSLASSTTVAFHLTDDAGRVMPNVSVEFSSNATADRGITVTANAVSDSAGRVVTVLSAGTIPGPVTVRVSAESGLIGSDGSPILRTSQSNPIPIVGGLPSFETSSFECGPFGVSSVYAPYTVSCNATLVDKFSNVVPDLLVQFTAEAAGEAASVAAADGVATVDIASTGELRPRADVLGWSYGLAIPNTWNQLTGTTFTAADAQACFDDMISTQCNLVKLCDDPSASAQAYCPLPENGGSCLDHAQPSNEVAPGVRAASALLDDTTLTPLTAATTRAGEIAAYVDDYRSCGFPVSCLRGERFGLGLDVVAGDYCPINPGCMDFTTTTECPQDSVRTLIAAVRGAEAFSDNNGNGVFDFDDTNGNGLHDAGEAVLGDAFVDLPEPYLDRNDNCFRDDLSNADRFLYRPIEKVRNTDQFYDVNGDEAFGFGVDAETSGAWDFDTQIFFTEKLLEIEDAHLEFGEACTTAGASHSCADGTVSRCIETGLGERFAPDCGIPRFSNTAGGGAVTSHTVAFRWTDGVGNCPSVNFTDSSAVAVIGFTTVTGMSNADLDYDYCSFSEQANPMLPYCTSVPFSGAPLQYVTITEDCLSANLAVSQVQVNFTLDGGQGRAFAEKERIGTTLTCN
ncbi:MAG: Ig-like domain-containing protein [Deltaproteobacteria bacterium]|nr:Ig-like domain-containing protein [Deltaproteobacteria bacterium]